MPVFRFQPVHRPLQIDPLIAPHLLRRPCFDLLRRNHPPLPSQLIHTAVDRYADKPGCKGLLVLQLPALDPCPARGLLHNLQRIGFAAHIAIGDSINFAVFRSQPVEKGFLIHKRKLRSPGLFHRMLHRPPLPLSSICGIRNSSTAMYLLYVRRRTAAKRLNFFKILAIFIGISLNIL
ncbi:hypothetical protein D3C73_1206130 [compost metagenome]